MRSYYAHLETAMGTAKKTVLAKPVFRSSAIFPVFNMPGISSRILFMGYWILKRHIKQISAVITLRSQEGTPLHRMTLSIEEAKTYRIELSDQLSQSGLSPSADFTGTLEVEFFSTVGLVFPYPAVAINYYGPHFSSVVHTAQRVYNDFDDMRNNSQTRVPESGFNIHVDDDHEPFIGIINGPEVVQNSRMNMQFFNIDGKMLPFEIDLGTLKPYELKVIYPARMLNLKEFLKGKVGAGKVRFQVNWIFPRLLVGNIQQSEPAMTITHTYYDCTAATSESDYWNYSSEEWYQASLMLPAYVRDKEFTNIYFYPIYSPSKFFIDLEIYNSLGERLGEKKEVLTVESPSEGFHCIDIRKLCKAMHIAVTEPLAIRVMARKIGSERLPARIKLGLDIGAHLQQMPCNICTNLQPYNPSLETKPSTFHWSPVLSDQPKASLWIMSSSPAMQMQHIAQITLTFFREQDSKTIVRQLNLPPHGFIVIRPEEETELQEFFQGTVGWCTVVSSNPYTTTYYLAENPSGVIGGDHGF